MKNPGWLSRIVVALPFGGLVTACSLAVERWGAVAFWAILIPALAVSVGLLTMERFKAYRDDMRVWLPVLYAFLAGAMGSALGLALWQELLIGAVCGLVVWFVVDRVLPAPESPSENAG